MGECDKAIVLAHDPPPCPPKPASFVTQNALEKVVGAILKARRATEM